MARRMTQKPERSSVIAAEVDQFNALAADWWDVTGPMAPLHRLNPARLAFIRDTLAKHHGGTVAGLKVLDLGCGAGILAEPLARQGLVVTGVDAAPAAIAAAQAHAAAQDLLIDYRTGTVESLLADGAQFDAVCALEILEHVADPAAFVAMVTQLVRPGGVIILSTLNRTIKSFALGIVAAEYMLGWVPRGTHNWHQFIPPAQLSRWLRENNCTLSAMSGVVYNPWQQDFRLSPHDLSVNYLLAAVRV